LFAPKSARGLRIDYPELNNVKEFESLRPAEILFVWNYGCKSSPYFNIDMDERELIKRCMEASNFIISDPTKKAEFLEGKFPDKIKASVPVMNSFEPSLRVIAKIEAAKRISDIRKLTSLELDNDGNHVSFHTKDGDIDFNKRMNYMKQILLADDEMPKLVSKAEQGFGLTEKKDSLKVEKHLGESGKTFAEEYHDHT